jgi:flagellar biosynthetic protein FlhB
MAEDKNQERTEKATEKRRLDARKKGQVAVSKEISSAFGLLSALLVLNFGGPWMFKKITMLMSGTFQDIAESHLNEISFHLLLLNVGWQFLVIVAPLMGAIMITGIASNILQTGFLFSTEAMSPKISKINPISGFKRLYSLRSLVELVKSLTKIILIGGIAFWLLKGKVEELPVLMRLDIYEILRFIGTESLNIGFYIFLSLMVLAIFDYGFQRWHYEKDLRMTKEEIKEETKHTEGDPKIKARIRALQQEMSRNRMMSMVPDATVVITNPTHFSIALKYDQDSMMAPKVLAKGAGFIAKKIKTVAIENNIPIVEDKPLARALYKTAEVDEYISVELYRAVAEIIAYVYKLGKMQRNETL